MISLNLLTQVWNKAFFLISQKLLTKYFTNTLVYGTYIKIKQNGISGNPLNLIIDFLNLRKRVVLNGKFHLWANISAGVPQELMLATLFFLIYLNDLSIGLSSNPKPFAYIKLLYCLLFII